MDKYSKIYAILGMLLLILGQSLWIYHSISESIYMLRYGEELIEGMNGLWMYADMLISIILLLFSFPFLYLSYRTGELWIKNKFVNWLTIAIISTFTMIVLRFSIEMKFVYFTLLQIILSLILFTLPIYWIIKFWNSDKSNNRKLIENNKIKNT